MLEIINKLYHNRVISRLFHTVVYCLKRELADCYSVLDLGCGPDSPVKYCRNVKYSIGVEAFAPYLEESKKRKIHTEGILASITDLNFKPKSFDAVVLIEVLEHLSKEQGKILLEKAEGWTREKVIITTPNGYLPQNSINQNPFQVHRSGWTIEEMRKRGYRAYGMAGWKSLRKENSSSEDGIFSTIRFRPNILWMTVSELSQAITYYFPKLAFEVFFVKRCSTRS